MNAEKKKKWKRGILLLLLSVIAFINLFPLVWLLDYSLLNNSDFYGDSIMKLPAPPLWSNYLSAVVEDVYKRQDAKTSCQGTGFRRYSVTLYFKASCAYSNSSYPLHIIVFVLYPCSVMCLSLIHI